MRLFRRQVQHIGLQDLSDLIDGRVAGPRKEQVEAHLELCDLCRREMEGLRYAVDLLQQAPMLAPRRRLIMQEAPAPVVARPMILSWAYGAAASVAVLLAVVLGADLMGALPSGGSDFAPEQSAFSDDQFESDVPMEAAAAGLEEASIPEALPEGQMAAKTLSDEAMESGPAGEGRAARSFSEITAEPDRSPGTHVLWRVLEGALAATFTALIVIGLLRFRRSRRQAP